MLVAESLRARRRSDFEPKLGQSVPQLGSIINLVAVGVWNLGSASIHTADQVKGWSIVKLEGRCVKPSLPSLVVAARRESSLRIFCVVPRSPCEKQGRHRGLDDPVSLSSIPDGH